MEKLIKKRPYREINEPEKTPGILNAIVGAVLVLLVLTALWFFLSIPPEKPRINDRATGIERLGEIK